MANLRRGRAEGSSGSGLCCPVVIELTGGFVDGFLKLALLSGSAEPGAGHLLLKACKLLFVFGGLCPQRAYLDVGSGPEVFGFSKVAAELRKFPLGVTVGLRRGGIERKLEVAGVVDGTATGNRPLIGGEVVLQLFEQRVQPQPSRLPRITCSIRSARYLVKYVCGRVTSRASSCQAVV